ncbi:MAG: AMP-binding protein, partial [Nitrosopumilaceae archaeon]|nr:AMP-binding protein [Nitrosopumilaceae archaeon]
MKSMMKNPDSHVRLDQMYTNAFQQYWDLPLFTDYSGETYTFKEIAERIEELKITMKEAGLEPGDKIAIYARNSTNWAITFFSIVAFGGVVVPI